MGYDNPGRWMFVVVALISLTGRAQPPSPNQTSRPSAIGSATTVPSLRRVDVPIRPVFIQTLPDEISEVLVGPDQRLWCKIVVPRSTLYINEIIRSWETEWGREMPQLQMLAPVLLEPGGRMWLVSSFSGRSVLRGWDGKNWIEHELTEKTSMRGSSPNHYSAYGAHNAFVNGTAFFVHETGVSTFDGKQWAYQAVTSDGPRRQFHFHIEPDGAGVMAIASLGDKSVLWRWREGRWESWPAAGPLGYLRCAAPAQDGVWLLTDGLLRFHPYKIGEVVAARVRELNSPKKEVREAAQQALVDLGPGAISSIEKCLLDVEQPEVINRLQEAMVSIRQPRKPTKESRCGEYALDDVQHLQYFGNGWISLAAKSIKPGAPNGGAILISPAGKMTLLAGEEYRQAFGASIGSNGGPLCVDEKRAWMLAMPTRLFNFETLKFEAESPTSAQAHSLLAVKRDGTLFQGRSDGVVVVTPGMPDDRKKLPFESRALSYHHFSIAPDGCIYALGSEVGLIRFDGKQWHDEGAAVSDRSYYGGAFGSGGELLIRTERRYAYRDKQGWTDAKELRDLVGRKADSMRAAYLKPPSKQKPPLTFDIACDAGGNLWVLDQRKLAVLCGDKWEDPAKALLAAGAGRESPRSICPVGDGSRVFVTFERQASVLGHVRNGTVVFVSAEDAGSIFRRDADGAVWVNAIEPPQTYAFPPKPPKRILLKVTEKGVTEKLSDTGIPVLLDESGNLWCNAGPIRRGSRVNILGNGKLIHSLEVPDASHPFHLMTDRPGSIYTWTRRGLLHLSGPAKGDGSWQAGETATVDLKFSPREMEVSRLGFAVLSTADSYGKDCQIHLVKLPDR